MSFGGRLPYLWPMPAFVDENNNTMTGNEMTIYHYSQWVDPSKNKEWYSLEVINQWDWVTKPVCYKILNGRHLIAYSLNKNLSINNTQYSQEAVTDLSQEIKDKLIEMGYSLNNIK